MKKKASKVKEGRDLNKWIMPDDAESRKPIAVKFVVKADPKSAYTVHSLARCVDDLEKELYEKVMTTGKQVDVDEIVAVPVFKSGVSKSFRGVMLEDGEMGIRDTQRVQGYVMELSPGRYLDSPGDGYGLTDTDDVFSAFLAGDVDTLARIAEEDDDVSPEGYPKYHLVTMTCEFEDSGTIEDF